MNKKVKSISLSMLILAIVFMTACTENEENKLDNRVKAYWDAKIKKDFDIAYTFLTPGWRATENKTSYENRISIGKVKWVFAKMKSKECSNIDVCKVTVTIGYKYNFPGAGGKIESDTDIVENWLMKDNIWYMLPNKR